MAACSQTNPLVLRTKLGPTAASFAVDTGAAVNVLSETAYKNLKRASRGGRWPLRPNDLVLRGVTSEPLHILGIVSIPMYLGKGTPILRLDFYVVSDFSLPADGLLGLTALKSSKMVIQPNKGEILYQGRTFKAMEQPTGLTALGKEDERQRQCFSQPQAESPVLAVRNTSPVAGSSNNSTVEDKTGGNWMEIGATVIGNHEIPDRTAMHIPVAVPGATVGCDICLESHSHVNRLAVEPTLNTVRTGNRTLAFVVNTTGGPVKIKQGVLLTQALAYDRQVVEEPLLSKSQNVASVYSGTSDKPKTATPTIDSIVKIQDYPELRSSLVKLLDKYREVIALPGEGLGSTTRAEHIIKLKPGTQPIYIPAYRLPHSQRQIMEEHVKEMKAQAVIQNSRSPWNSPLFLVPKKDGTYRPVIDFRKVNEATEDD